MLKEKDNHISLLESDLNKHVSELNDAEQYSRKNSIRIIGLKLKNPRSAMDPTLLFFNNKFDVNLTKSDLCAVHQVSGGQKNGRRSPSHSG